jgi:PAS domain-containing protein
VLNEEEGVFEYRAAVGWDLARLSRIKIPKDCIVQRKLGHRGPIIVRDAQRFNHEFLPPEIARELDEFPVAAFVSFPVEYEGEVIAYFNLDNLDNPDAFSEEDLKRLAFVEEEITLAVRLAREREQLAEREELFRLLFERLADAVYITALDGTILEANPAASRQTGYSRDELIGMNIIQDLAAEPTVAPNEVNESLLRGGACAPGAEPLLTPFSANVSEINPALTRYSMGDR